ncbi:hypothetical protein D9M68_719950 [compost metagenome]
MLVDQGQQIGMRRRNDGPEGYPRAASGRNPHALPEREDRVEHGTDRIRERQSGCDDRARGGRTAVFEKPRPVGLILRIGDKIAFHHAEVGRPHGWFRGRAKAACCGQRAGFRQVSGLDEHPGEGRMRVIGRARSERQFGVGSQFDFTWAASVVDQRYAADLAVVLAGNQDFQDGCQAAVVSHELSAIFGKGHFANVLATGARLRAGRPGNAALRIAQKDEGA